jgi:hypothetical protein
VYDERVTRRLLAIAIAIAGCNDPSLRVSIAHDPDYGRDVDMTRVSVYEPGSESFNCAAVRFGDVDPAAFEAARVDTAVSGTDDTVLSGISTTDLKVIVAEGFADGQRIVAGCKDVDAIEGHRRETIETVPVVQIAIADAGIDLSFNAPMREIEVAAATLDTASNDPMLAVGRRVQWIAYGPASGYGDGTSTIRSTQPICTGADGVARIAPPDPARPGPIAAEVLVEWASTSPPRTPGFVSPSTPVFAFDRVDSATPSCVPRIDGAGRPTLVCLNGPMAGMRDVVELRLAGGAFVSASLGPRPDDTAFGLVVDPATQDVWALETDGDWQGLAGTPDQSSPAFCRGISGCKPIRVITVPGCGSDPPRVAVELDNTGPMIPSFIAVHEIDGTWIGDIATATSAEIATVSNPTLLGGGCVQVIGDTPRQAIVAANGSQSVNVAAVTCPTGWCAARWNSLGGIGFVADPMTGEPHLIGSELDVTGIALVEWVVFADGDRYQLVERRRQSVAAPPPAVLSGMFDDDANPDLVWLLNIPAPEMRVGIRLQIALDTGDLEGGARLMGFSPIKLNDLVSSVVAADLDDDGIDDVITYNQIDAIAYPMGVTVTPSPPTGEDRCP